MTQTRQFAIGDIHGCAKTFRQLVRSELHIQAGEHLILLGDVIDRGPDSKGVLDEIFALRAEGVRVQVLQGNHEEMLNAAVFSSKHHDYWLNCGGREFLESFGVTHVSQVPAIYLDELRYSELYIETATHLFVHAGFNFSKSNLFEDTYAMRWMRAMEVDPKRTGNRPVLHGHTPRPLDVLLKQNAYNINLDSGCVYADVEGMGYLLAYETHSQAFFPLKNCEAA